MLQNATFDLVYDTVGQDNTGDRAMRLLKQGGYYVTITGQLAPAKCRPKVPASLDAPLQRYTLRHSLKTLHTEQV